MAKILNFALFKPIHLQKKQFSGSADKYWRHRNKKHKKQPFSDASASHLSLVLWYV